MYKTLKCDWSVNCRSVLSDWAMTYLLSLKTSNNTNLVLEAPKRHYTNLLECACGSMRNVTTTHTAVYRSTTKVFPAVCGNPRPPMRRDTKNHHYICGSMRKTTTANAAICEIPLPHTTRSSNKTCFEDTHALFLITHDCRHYNEFCSCLIMQKPLSDDNAHFVCAWENVTESVTGEYVKNKKLCLFTLPSNYARFQCGTLTKHANEIWRNTQNKFLVPKLHSHILMSSHVDLNRYQLCYISLFIKIESHVILRFSL